LTWEKRLRVLDISLRELLGVLLCFNIGFKNIKEYKFNLCLGSDLGIIYMKGLWFNVAGDFPEIT